MSISSFYIYFMNLFNFFLILSFYVFLGMFLFFYCYFNILVTIFQSLFYLVLLFGFYLKVNCFDNKEYKSYFFKKFILKYLIMESCVDLFFFILYLCNCDLYYGVIFLFKQGVFPFLFYFSVLGNIFFKYFILSVYLLFLFVTTKIWGCFLFSKLIFCLNFYIFNIFLTMFCLFFCLNKVLYSFICTGLVFNNMLLIFVYWIFDFYFIVFYLVLYFFYYYNVFILVNWFYKKVNNLLSKDFFYKWALMFSLVHGNTFMMFIFCKVVLFLSCSYYSISFIIFYFILSVIFIWNSFVIMLNSFKFFKKKLLLLINLSLIVFIFFFLCAFGTNFYIFMFFNC